jgi:pimeloyl-ACP methyl ester carboxylesterase
MGLDREGRLADQEGMTTTSGTEKIDLGTHKLRVRSSGSGARTFVCIHGLAETLEGWDELGARLERTSRVIRYDQRAHGDSTAPDGACSRSDLAADLVAVLDRLEVPRAVLIGHGVGGLAALTTVLAAPARVAGLVLLATPTQLDEREARWFRDVIRAGEVNALEGLARGIHGPISRNQVEGDAPGIVAVARMAMGLQQEPLTPRLGEISCATLVLLGERDAAAKPGSELLARGIAGARLEVIPGAGRRPQVDAPDAVAAAILGGAA